MHQLFLKHSSTNVSYCILPIYSSIAHPFLLADNRHFTFYIWRHVLRHEPIRLGICPLYCICVMLLQRTLAHKPIMWQIIYLVALSLTLIPSPLIEFRYFIIPYFIWRLNMKNVVEPEDPVDSKKRNRDPPPLWWQLPSEVAWYLLINGVAFSLFLFYPFSWSSSPGEVQRFMW